VAKQGDLDHAYELLRKFKDGELEAGRLLSDSEVSLFKLLINDLLPERIADEVDGEKFEDLILEVAQADSRWNRALGDALHEFYQLRDSGNNEGARKRLESFVESCPSNWYRGYALAELE